LEGRIGQLDEFLSFTCDLRRFIRIVGNARISQATLTRWRVREVSVASSGEEGQAGGWDDIARVWSWLLNDRIKRNWRRRREEIRTVDSGWRRASKNCGLTKDSLSFSEDTHRHFRNREWRELEGWKLGGVEVAVSSGVVRWLNTLSRINSNFIVEVVGRVFSNFEVAVWSSLEFNSVVREFNGCLVSNQVISSTRH
jgi:hypothetical protein